MPESLPRPLIALTVVVAVLALYVGVKDYLDKKKHSAGEGSTPSVAAYSSDAGQAKKPKHVTSKRVKTSSSPAHSRASVLAESEDMGKPVVSAEMGSVSSASPGAEGQPSVGGGAGEEYTRDPSGVMRSSLNTTASASTCLPLPNRTNPGDVDAPYYQNWSREYCSQ